MTGLDLILRGTVVLAAAILAAAAMRRASAAARHLVWTAAFAALLLLPAAIGWGPKLPVRALPAALGNASPAALLQELRGRGRNLHRDRFAGLRGRNWYAGLQRCLQQGLSPAQTPQRLELTFEIIYGHAFKPAARMRVSGASTMRCCSVTAPSFSGEKSVSVISTSNDG